MNSDQAKRINLKDLLSRLGFEPHHEAKGEYWYLSPFRPEKEPSMHIKQDGDKWFYNDFGEGGGNVIDFAMTYWRVGFREALRELARYDYTLPLFSQAARPAAPLSAQPATSEQPERQANTPAITITKTGPLFHYALKNYVEGRGIAPELAKDFLHDVHFTLAKNGSSQFALGFKNDSGGYELRRAGFQSSTHPKDITFLKPPQDAQDAPVALFEGFMDFLTAKQLNALPDGPVAVLVLNSATMKARALKRIEEYGTGKVYLFLDHDSTGRELTEYFKARLNGREVQDQSGLYAGYKDFNALLEARKARASGLG